jgi:hypothetical protein
MSSVAEKQKMVFVSRSGIGMLWLAGWLFTVGWVHLTGWKVLWSLFAWPYFLGTVAR